MHLGPPPTCGLCDDTFWYWGVLSGPLGGISKTFEYGRWGEEPPHLRLACSSQLGERLGPHLPV